MAVRNATTAKTSSTNAKWEEATGFMNQDLVWDANGTQMKMKVPPMALKASDQFGVYADRIYASGDAAAIEAFEAWYRAHLVIQYRPNVKSTVAVSALPVFVK